VNNSCWLYIEPYVHITLKNENVLLYNTVNGESIRYFNEPFIAALIKKLINKKNRWVLMIDEKTLSSTTIQKFIDEIRNKFIGDIIPTNWSNKKPFIFVPYPIINRKLGKQLNLPGKNKTLEYGNYLNEITLYINNLSIK